MRTKITRWLIKRVKCAQVIDAPRHHRHVLDSSLVDQQQWTEIDGDTRRLQEIVQSQQDQIKEIVSLISQAGRDRYLRSLFAYLSRVHLQAVPSSSNAHSIETPVQSSEGVIHDLLQKIRSVTHANDEHTPTPTILENHSPGISPSQSLTTLISASLTHHANDSINSNAQVTPPPTSSQLPVVEPPPHETKICPICNASFVLTSEADEMAIYDHIERCLFPALPTTTPQDYVCPVCERKFPGNDENMYHQHLSDCINRDQFA